MDRHLSWQGCFNARDLGGLRAAGGRTTRWKAVVRSDSLDNLTAAGWSALWAHGVRTIVDLRNDEERQADAVLRPAGLTTVHMPLEDLTDTEFWDHWGNNGLNSTPLYYQPFLERMPQRCAAVVAAIAQAHPGGVLVHCGVGRDRTGIITMLLLALVGVAPEDIFADYELSTERLRPRFAALGQADQGPRIAEILAYQNTSARALILATLASLDADAYLHSGGLSDADLAAVRTRLLGGD